jgi:hypothetical protein
MEYSMHNKLKIRSDIDLGLPSFFKQPISGTPDLDISVGFKKVTDADYVFPPYVHHKKNMLLHRYGFVTPCQLTLEDFEGDTKITFTRAYKRLVGVRKLLECVLDLKLLQKGLVKTHGACVELRGGTGVMIAGWDHSGKSTLAISMVNDGAKFLSDDITLVSEDRAYAYPKNIKTFTGMHILARKLNSVPFVNRALGLNRGVPPKNVTGSTNVKYLFVSRYGKKSVRGIGKAEAEMALSTMSVYVTAPFDSRHLVLEYCHYNKYDIDRLLERRREIIRGFLRDVKCFELTSTNVHDSEDLIRKTLGKRV